MDGTDGAAGANSTYRAARSTVTGRRSAAALSLGVADEKLGGR